MSGSLFFFFSFLSSEKIVSILHGSYTLVKSAEILYLFILLLLVTNQWRKKGNGVIVFWLYSFSSYMLSDVTTKTILWGSFHKTKRHYVNTCSIMNWNIYYIANSQPNLSCTIARDRYITSVTWWFVSNFLNLHF